MPTRKVLIVFIVAVLAAALIIAGCGGSKSSNSSTGGSPAASAASMTADEVMAKAKDATNSVTSMSFTGDVTLTVKADTAKISDPTTKALASQPIKVHAEGAIGKPATADITASLAAGGQTLNVGLKATDNQAWVEFANKWYTIPPSQLKSVTKQTGGSPDKALSKLGIDPTTWTGQSSVTTEQLGGATVYHVTTKADTQKVMSDLMKALNTPGLTSGQSGAVLKQLKSSKQVQELEKSLTAAQADYWVDAQTFNIVKASITANMTFAGSLSSQGLQGATAAVIYTADNFNQTVTVEPPASPLPFSQLQQGLGQLIPSGTGL
jgi:Family of unknown function (DUF6612)